MLFLCCDGFCNDYRACGHVFSCCVQCAAKWRSASGVILMLCIELGARYLPIYRPLLSRWSPSSLALDTLPQTKSAIPKSNSLPFLLLSCVTVVLLVTVLCDSVSIRYIVAVMRDRLLWGWALCLNHNRGLYFNICLLSLFQSFLFLSFFIPTSSTILFSFSLLQEAIY